MANPSVTGLYLRSILKHNVRNSTNSAVKGNSTFMFKLYFGQFELRNNSFFEKLLFLDRNFQLKKILWKYPNSFGENQNFKAHVL